MAIEFKRRLQKLEAALNPVGSKFYVWDRGDKDIKTEIARIRAERGLSANAEAVIIRWLRPGEKAQLEGLQ
jgi:hypothetical protein